MTIQATYRSFLAVALTLFSVLVSLPTACAQSRDILAALRSCPVSMDSVKIDHNVMYFYYQDTSTKDVDGVMFDAAYYDSAQTPHHIDVWGSYNDLVHPAKYKKGALDIKFLRDRGFSGIAIWPTKVLFRDGTSWAMPSDGQNCAVIKRGTKQQAGLLPPRTALSILASNSH